MERTRERVPLDWAGTKNNLGNALGRLGERESGTARLEEAVVRLEEAVEAYRDALMEQTPERMPLEWALSIGNQGVALMLLAERTKNAVLAEMAVQQIEAAFKAVRAAGHLAFAGYFEWRLPQARAIRSRVKGL